MQLPRLYAIADNATLGARGASVEDFARQLRDAGVMLLQYRDKLGGPLEVLRAAAEISTVFSSTRATLILNDRADLALLAGWSGVHVGQGDLTPEDAKRIFSLDGKLSPLTTSEREGHSLVGVSTHCDVQVAEANNGEADYLAVGPVFATSTKLNADPIVGLDGVRRARSLTTKPLVAIGGITRQNVRSVMAAGADSVAVIGGLLVAGESVEKVARDFLELLR